MHSTRINFIGEESFSKLKKAIKHIIRTYTNVVCKTGEKVYFKRKDDGYWKGPGTVIGIDEQQVLAKETSSYIRIYSYNLPRKTILLIMMKLLPLGIFSLTLLVLRVDST